MAKQQDREVRGENEEQRDRLKGPATGTGLVRFRSFGVVWRLGRVKWLARWLGRLVPVGVVVSGANVLKFEGSAADATLETNGRQTVVERECWVAGVRALQVDAGDAGDAGKATATTRRAEGTMRRTGRMARRGRSHGRQRRAKSYVCQDEYVFEVFQLAVLAVKVVAMSWR